MSVFLRKFRSLPPAGGSTSPLGSLSEFLNSGKQSTDNIKSLYPEHEVYFMDSGTSALLLALTAIRSLRGDSSLLMSAYTCPDIASAAINAGLKIKLFDLNPESLQPDPVQFNNSNFYDGISSIIFSNLYGIRDTIPENIPDGIFVIDDACQAALSIRGDTPVGVSRTHIGIFSFGRGKAFPAAGGGMLLVPKSNIPEKNLEFDQLNKEITKIYTDLKKNTLPESIKYFAELSLMKLFERPQLYWIVQNLPFLRLGQTIVKNNIKMKKASDLIISVMHRAIKESSVRRSLLHQKAGLYSDLIESIAPDAANTLIRLPLLIPEDQKKLISDNLKTNNKYGISLSYPNLIGEYPEIAPYISSTSHLPGVCYILKSLVTLPVHEFLTKDDVLIIKKLLKI